MISGAVDGNGVKPCSGRTEGWKEGRGGAIVMEGSAVTYRKVGEGRAFNSESLVPFLKEGGGRGAAQGVMVCDKTPTTAAQLT